MGLGLYMEPTAGAVGIQITSVAEVRIALEEWHSRIPEYRLADGQTIAEHGGMFGIDSLSLVWGQIPGASDLRGV